MFWGIWEVIRHDCKTRTTLTKFVKDNAECTSVHHYPAFPAGNPPRKWADPEKKMNFFAKDRSDFPSILAAVQGLAEVEILWVVTYRKETKEIGPTGVALCTARQLNLKPGERQAA